MVQSGTIIVPITMTILGPMLVLDVGLIMQVDMTALKQVSPRVYRSGCLRWIKSIHHGHRWTKLGRSGHRSMCEQSPSERDKFHQFRKTMRFRRRLLLISMATMAGCELLMGLVPDQLMFPILVVGFMFFMVSVFVHASSICARCDNTVFARMFLAHPFRARCAHCGLRLYSKESGPGMEKA